MCKRKCDKCGSSEHIHMHGITGTYFICECNRILEFQYDIEACPTYLKTYEEVEKYAAERSYINCKELGEQNVSAGNWYSSKIEYIARFINRHVCSSRSLQILRNWMGKNE